MNLVLLLTAVWLFSLVITSVVRYGFVKDSFDKRGFLIMSGGTYLLMWACVGIAFLLILIFDL